MKSKLIIAHELKTIDKNSLISFLDLKTLGLSRYAAFTKKKKLVRELKLFWCFNIEPSFKVPMHLTDVRVNLVKRKLMENGTIMYGKNKKPVKIEDISFIISYQNYVPFKTQIEEDKGVN